MRAAKSLERYQHIVKMHSCASVWANRSTMLEGESTIPLQKYERLGFRLLLIPVLSPGLLAYLCKSERRTFQVLEDELQVCTVQNISEHNRKTTFFVTKKKCIKKGGCVLTFDDGDRFNSCQVIYSQFGLAIHQNDHQTRRRFVEWAQNEIAVVPDFHKRILFSDEAHFWLNGYVNKQNCRIWSEANPQVYVETPLHPEKLTVWCALWAGGILLQKR
ncbi:hypothetical protein TNCV_3322731 [Trichonephila clavipes]|nr:hypothetical protein TNCV_3322731 [Trichonephila clavipes]